MHDKYKFWLSVGGHIELDEDPVEAALREVKEEVGLDVKIAGEAHGISENLPENKGYKYLIPPRYLGRHPVSDTHEHIAFVYFARSEIDVITEPASEHERGETVWASREDLDQMDLVPNVRFYAEKALEELAS